jgi:Concanavalin A-like lectin/glucanases superfamily
MTPHLSLKWLRRAIMLGATASAIIAFSAASASASSLVGWWPMNEGSGQTAYDWSGRGNHGKLGATDAPDSQDPGRVSGLFGRALEFGGDDYVRIPDSPVLEPSTVTVSTFFRADQSPGQWRHLVSKGAANCKASSYGLYSGKNGGLGFYVSDGNAYAVSPLATPDVWNGKWHHAAGTFDGTTVRLFVDGQQVGAGTPTTVKLGYDLPDGDIPYLGGYLGDCDFLFQGRLDEVMIWNSALPLASLFDRIAQRR